MGPNFSCWAYNPKTWLISYIHYTAGNHVMIIRIIFLHSRLAPPAGKTPNSIMSRATHIILPARDCKESKSSLIFWLNSFISHLLSTGLTMAFVDCRNSSIVKLTDKTATKHLYFVPRIHVEWHGSLTNLALWLIRLLLLLPCDPVSSLISALLSCNWPGSCINHHFKRSFSHHQQS